MSYQNQLDLAITITSNMLSTAKNEKWDQVICLEKKRQSLLLAMGKLPQVMESSNTAEKLETLIVLNNKLEELSSEELIKCETQFNLNKNSRKAFKAYANI